MPDSSTPPTDSRDNGDRPPNEPRDVIDTDVNASATAHTRSVVGSDTPQRTGTVSANVSVAVDCTCSSTVTVYSNQPVICQTCGRRWSM